MIQGQITFGTFATIDTAMMVMFLHFDPLGMRKIVQRGVTFVSTPLVSIGKLFFSCFLIMCCLASKNGFFVKPIIFRLTGFQYFWMLFAIHRLLRKDFFSMFLVGCLTTCLRFFRIIFSPFPYTFSRCHSATFHHEGPPGEWMWSKAAWCCSSFGRRLAPQAIIIPQCPIFCSIVA